MIACSERSFARTGENTMGFPYLGPLPEGVVVAGVTGVPWRVFLLGCLPMNPKLVQPCYPCDALLFVGIFAEGDMVPHKAYGVLAVRRKDDCLAFDECYRTNFFMTGHSSAPIDSLLPSVEIPPSTSLCYEELLPIGHSRPPF
ncbi:hypothetical protein Tco_0821494 [Tanacetum coccineum]|uniref:Uncharacterized protein n=1 Tax=Tanacetum coccineum TaxID=301880 RepID=A0ABQ5ACE2_9ASTR